MLNSAEIATHCVVNGKDNFSRLYIFDTTSGGLVFLSLGSQSQQTINMLEEVNLRNYGHVGRGDKEFKIGLTVVKHREQTTGKIYLTQSRDFRLEFKSVDDNDLEIVERVHYSDNTLDKALEFWSEKLGLPIMGNVIDILPRNFLMQ